LSLASVSGGGQGKKWAFPGFLLLNYWVLKIDIKSESEYEDFACLLKKKLGLEARKDYVFC